MQDASSSLTCPICKSAIKQEAKQFKCSSRHTYDIAKEGYVNLLPVQNKSSLSPGDNAEMVRCRSRFLSKGYYEPLAKALKEIWISKNFKQPCTILDIGCGEGYYTEAILKNSNEDNNVLGFDISKYAVKAAAKKSKAIQYFVASANDIPLIDGSVDAAQCIFAPLNEKEISRILKKDGSLLVVSAGPNHLKELALMIYDSFRPHQNTQSEKLKSDFKSLEQKTLNFKLQLTQKESITDLLQMTPYGWKATEEKKKTIQGVSELKLTCDFHLELFRKVF